MDKATERLSLPWLDFDIWYIAVAIMAVDALLLIALRIKNVEPRHQYYLAGVMAGSIAFLCSRAAAERMLLDKLLVLPLDRKAVLLYILYMAMIVSVVPAGLSAAGPALLACAARPALQTQVSVWGLALSTVPVGLAGGLASLLGRSEWRLLRVVGGTEYSKHLYIAVFSRLAEITALVLSVEAPALLFLSLPEKSGFLAAAWAFTMLLFLLPLLLLIAFAYTGIVFVDEVRGVFQSRRGR